MENPWCCLELEYVYINGECVEMCAGDKQVTLDLPCDLVDHADIYENGVCVEKCERDQNEE